MNDEATNAWTRAALWLVAAAFAAFLIGLGGKLLAKLWDLERPVALQQFIDVSQAAPLQQAMREADSGIALLRLAVDEARHKHGVASTNTALARENFDVWVRARQSQARPDQDAELLARTAELDQVRAAEQAALLAFQKHEQSLQAAQRRREQLAQRWRAMERAALASLEQARWQQQLRLFGYRVAITTPLVLLALWLFVKKRASAYWPFVWGYITFAAFAFFVELVPHVPSYSGYVRYIVGIVLTVMVGRFAIRSLRDAEAEGMRNDAVAAHRSISQCPGCARAVDLEHASGDYCPGCGTALFDYCAQCKTRKVALARFCTSCGTPGAARPAA